MKGSTTPAKYSAVFSRRSLFFVIAIYLVVVTNFLVGGGGRRSSNYNPLGLFSQFEEGLQPDLEGYNGSAVEVTISVITYNRLSSLQRLLESLLAADYRGDAVSLSFTLEAGAPLEIQQAVSDFHWPFGKKLIRQRVLRTGLISAVAESWFPLHDNQYAVFLEDDIEVSPLFYQYLKQTLSKVENDPLRSRIIGISLYTPRVVETALPRRIYLPDAELPSSNGCSLYLHQLPCSWGAMFFPTAWREFQRYLSFRTNNSAGYLNVPYATSNGWKSSWKKYMIELMYATGSFMIYPNFPNQTSLSTNHLEPGEHIGKSSAIAHNEEEYVVPLLAQTEKHFLDSAMTRCTSLASLPKLDLFNLQFGDTKKLSADRCVAGLQDSGRGVAGIPFGESVPDQLPAGTKLYSGTELVTSASLLSIPQQSGQYEGYFFKGLIKQTGLFVIELRSPSNKFVRTVFSSPRGPVSSREISLQLHHSGALVIAPRSCAGPQYDSLHLNACGATWIAKSETQQESRFFLYLHPNGDLNMYHGCSTCYAFRTPVWSSNSSQPDFEDAELPCESKGYMPDMLSPGSFISETKKITAVALPGSTTAFQAILNKRGDINVLSINTVSKSTRFVERLRLFKGTAPHGNKRMYLQRSGNLILYYLTGSEYTKFWESRYHSSSSHFLSISHGTSGSVSVSLREGYSPCEGGRSIWPVAQKGPQKACPAHASLQRRSLCGNVDESTFGYFVARHTFTVLLSTFTYSESSLLSKSIARLAANPFVEAVVVVWHRPFEVPPPNMMVNGKMVHFVQSYTDSLNNRFLRTPLLITEAVLVLDDDIFIHHDDLELLFQTWKLFKDKIVGFFPRWFDKNETYLFDGSDDTNRWKGYPLVLTKSMMLHKRYISEYACGMGTMFHRFVDRYKNCEDIAMNMIVASMTGGPSSIFVQPNHKIADFGHFWMNSALHKRTNHIYVRSLALRTYRKLIGMRHRLPFQNLIVTGGARTHGHQAFKLSIEAYKGVALRHVDCSQETLHQPPCSWAVEA